MGKPTPKDEIPLQPQVALEPFDKWGVVFIGPIDPPSGNMRYIIVCNGYLMKWDETTVVKAETEHKVAESLIQGAQFTSNMIEDLMRKHHIKHNTPTSYHPQENGQVEVTNRALESILTKVVSSNKKY